MGKVVVINHVTLDGVMQGPGRPDEDTRGGFVHGGWAFPRGDDAIVAKAGERMGGDRAFLFGRRTYEQQRLPPVLGAHGAVCSSTLGLPDARTIRREDR